jgi:hypothetical protein
MRPQFRCALNPAACPSSGSVVVVDADDQDEAPCMVCGSPLRIRPRLHRPSGRFLAKLPEHRAPDHAGERRTAAQLQRATKIAAVREYKARQAFKKRGRSARRALQLAIDAVTALPPSSTRDRRLTVLYKRAARIVSDEAPKPPRGAARQLAALEDASGLDVSSTHEVDPGWDRQAETGSWVEHLEKVLSKAALRRVRRTPPTRQIKAGLLELLRQLRATSWDDFGGRRFVGQESWLAFVREYPGLERLRLPDEAYAAAADELPPF